MSDRVTPFRLSEAIRLGSMLNPQGFEALRSAPKGIRVATPTCSLGAAFEAIGCPSHLERAEPGARTFRGTVVGGERVTAFDMPAEWQRLLNQAVICPACQHRAILGQMIPHLNDQHRWTRTRIAGLVQLIEMADPSKREMAVRKADSDRN